MKNQKHTPGPWKMYSSGYVRPKHEEFAKNFWVGFGETDSKGPGIVCNDIKPCYSGTSEGLDSRLIEQEANARLIASAPELIEALELVVNELRYVPGFSYVETIKIADSIIRKAKGEL